MGSSVKATCKATESMNRLEETLYHPLVFLTSEVKIFTQNPPFLPLPKSAAGLSSNKRDGNHNCSPDPTLHFLLPVFKS